MSDAQPDGGFFPAVYDELKRLAAARLAGERSGYSLDATVLVHEAYPPAGRSEIRRPLWLLPGRGRRHAADPGRPRPPPQGRQARGARTIALDGEAPAQGADPDLVLDANDALERLAREDPSSAEVARHRLFAGLSIDETAEARGSPGPRRSASGPTPAPGSPQCCV